MLPLPQLCALWGCLLTAVHLGQCVTCSDKQYLQGGECCDLCQPGNRLVSHCTALEKTQCQPCDSGEFSAHWNREIRCHQHRHCELNQGLQVKKEGTAVSDTVCTCKEGQHCASKECETCAQHTPCGPGFGVVQMATETTDTVCQPCPVGFFSNGSSLFEKCHPWTRFPAPDASPAGHSRRDGHPHHHLCGFSLYQWSRNQRTMRAELGAGRVTQAVLSPALNAGSYPLRLEDKILWR
ncbi:tumor necrosis factor receptor superfamily member 5 isoform X2 [Rattus norvegicus]|uniref:tumor necrosis factor receptor superfamily member 5 isoform X2 n=1 Tax=Rattus norvegicus TaxID=10116 RepID=UPI0004E4737D|nr:tumor necrosis factor receptor superfamily member 5 isoform X2 [Rattus norvegicus]|eukprot:XP_008760685.1 PREDICTED: tumor necrosis factor receptor superfamily member 5 isoform X2 [Rattus norvegicus]